MEHIDDFHLNIVTGLITIFGAITLLVLQLVLCDMQLSDFTEYNYLMTQLDQNLNFGPLGASLIILAWLIQISLQLRIEWTTRNDFSYGWKSRFCMKKSN